MCPTLAVEKVVGGEDAGVLLPPPAQAGLYADALCPGGHCVSNGGGSSLNTNIEVDNIPL